MERDRLGIKVGCLALLHRDRSLRAFSQAGTEAVAVCIAYESGLTVADLDGPFGAGRNALAAAVALLLIDSDYFTHSHRLLLRLAGYKGYQMDIAGSLI
jgi:hypothetical protein